jgi:hypothetical protein
MNLERAGFIVDLYGAALFSLATTDVTYYFSDAKVLNTRSAAVRFKDF